MSKNKAENAMSILKKNLSLYDLKELVALIEAHIETEVQNEMLRQL